MPIPCYYSIHFFGARITFFLSNSAQNYTFPILLYQRPENVCPKNISVYFARIFIKNSSIWHSNCFSCCAYIQEKKREPKKKNEPNASSKYSMSEKSNFSFYIANKIRYMASDFSLHALFRFGKHCVMRFSLFNDLCKLKRYILYSID